MFTLAAAIVVGFWVWWRLHAGAIGMIAGILAAVAIAAAVTAVWKSDTEEH